MECSTTSRAARPYCSEVGGIQGRVERCERRKEVRRDVRGRGVRRGVRGRGVRRGVRGLKVKTQWKERK